MTIDRETMLASHGPTGDAADYLAMAHRLESGGDLRAAASAADQAVGLDPGGREIVAVRRSLLDRLAVTEHGITFRYIPAGTFLMGSDAGDPDEAPVHPVRLGDYWLAETPMSWAAYCDLMGWAPPQEGGMPRDFDREATGPFRKDLFALSQENKIRLQYCEDQTARAKDWHSHMPERDPESGEWRTPVNRQHFRPPLRDEPDRPWTYDRKPMVAVSWQEAEEVCARLGSGTIIYRLPTEAKWEKAARGGRIGARYPWGNEPPDPRRCDFDRFDAFAIRPTRHFPPNDYGLYAMSGGVWEWTSDWYDSAYYRESPAENPRGPPEGEAKILRGGSWSDCAEAVTVSFRMARKSRSWRDREWGGQLAPNVGFRLCRVERTGH